MKEENLKAFQKVVKWGAIALAVMLIVSIIGGIAGIIFGIFGVETGVSDMRDYEISESFSDIDLEISAAEIKIFNGDQFSVKSNIKDLYVGVSHGTLNIEEKNKLFKNYNGAVLEITLPEGFSFVNAKLEAGAGNVNIERLSAVNLEMSLGAGKVTINELYASGNADIEGGAGELDIGGGSLCSLNFEMGVGKCTLRTRMVGECDLDMGIGEANVILIGAESEYKISLSAGLGGASYNGREVSNETVGNGACRVDIDGGIGKLNVTVGE
ncbi:MAG: DUF4097 family beta strand repeat protein [Clostridia bacterium]|nr:DUF4097 family beta strand repeat protein [Clostridia bacterium]